MASWENSIRLWWDFHPRVLADAGLTSLGSTS